MPRGRCTPEMGITGMLCLERTLAAGTFGSWIRHVDGLFQAFAFLNGTARALADSLALGYHVLRVPDQSACVQLGHGSLLAPLFRRGYDVADVCWREKKPRESPRRGRRACGGRAGVKK